MGSLINFFAFNEKPDLVRLRRAPWLSGWRLFHEAASNLWYLEGPSRYQSVTFFEKIIYSKTSGGRDADKFTTELRKAISASGGTRNAFDSSTFRIASKLSKTLNCEVLGIISDDDGLGSVFRCRDGVVDFARLQISWDKAIMFEVDGFSLEYLYPKGTDQELAVPREVHQIASEELGRFSGVIKPVSISSDPDDLTGRTIKLVDLKGEVPSLTEIEKLEKMLFRDIGIHANFKTIFNTVSPRIENALDFNLISAKNAERFSANDEIRVCVRFVSHSLDGRQSTNFKKLVSLSNLLQEILYYMSLLRPKPEFRKKSNDVYGLNKILNKKWRRMKFLIQFKL